MTAAFVCLLHSSLFFALFSGFFVGIYLLPTITQRIENGELLNTLVGGLID
jgi:hypothetical protein